MRCMGECGALTLACRVGTFADARRLVGGACFSLPREVTLDTEGRTACATELQW
jgi:hypothetical protein